MGRGADGFVGRVLDLSGNVDNFVNLVWVMGIVREEPLLLVSHANHASLAPANRALLAWPHGS